MTDPCDYLRQAYGVPAKVGGRVRFDYGNPVRSGEIVAADHHLLVRWDGNLESAPLARLHPTWRVTYLGPSDEVLWSDYGAT